MSNVVFFNVRVIFCLNFWIEPLPVDSSSFAITIDNSINMFDIYSTRHVRVMGI